MNGRKSAPCLPLLRLTPIVCICFFMVFSFGACKRSQTAGTTNTGRPAEVGSPQPHKAGKLYRPDMADCNGFTAIDAAGILGVPASNVTAKTKELYAGNWQCSFESGDLGKDMSFNVSVAKSVEEAVKDMAQYRSHLEAAGSVSPFKESLPNGAYTNVSGLGDEGVWTDINLSLAVRQGNVRVHVTMPKDEPMQMKVAGKFLTKLK
ncbi:MAG: hypothetical protein M0Z67_08305 [Nitrospiraceae bacterium]|nr:hypothetical protein [Nitrospiraceae bacterium]